MEIIYKHNYGTEDLLGAQIKICKHKTTNKYMIYAQFYAFDESVLPTIKTTYEKLKKTSTNHYRYYGVCIFCERTEKLFKGC